MVAAALLLLDRGIAGCRLRALPQDGYASSLDAGPGGASDLGSGASSSPPPQTSATICWVEGAAAASGAAIFSSSALPSARAFALKTLNVGGGGAGSKASLRKSGFLCKPVRPLSSPSTPVCTTSPPSAMPVPASAGTADELSSAGSGSGSTRAPLEGASEAPRAPRATAVLPAAVASSPVPE